MCSGPEISRGRRPLGVDRRPHLEGLQAVDLKLVQGVSVTSGPLGTRHSEVSRVLWRERYDIIAAIASTCGENVPPVRAVIGKFDAVAAAERRLPVQHSATD